MKGRIVSLLLAACMIIAMLPINAFAAEGEPEPACTCGAAPGEDGQTVHLPACPLYEAPEDPAGEEEQEQEEAQEQASLTAPAITAAPYDEWNSSDVVLTVAGDWDSYAWESCSYGYWSPWEGDGARLVLSKEDFVSSTLR